MEDEQVREGTAVASHGPATAGPGDAVAKRPPLAKRRSAVLLGQIALGLGLLASWHLLTGDPNEGAVLDEYYLSTPTGVFEALRTWATEGLLLESFWVTVETTVVGFVIGAVIGLVGGILLGINPFIARILSPYINAIYSIPRLALVPLFMLWFGIGYQSKIALVVSIVSFLVFYSTYAGVLDVSQALLDRLRLMGASRFQLHMKVTVPAAMTFIISGLRVSAPYALVGAVTAEMMQSNQGLGYLLIRSSNQFYTAGVFASIIAMMVLGVALMFAIRLAERRLLQWKPDAVKD